MNFLKEVVKSLNARLRYERPVERRTPLADFRSALGDFGIIAEYKRASPSGVIRLDLPPWDYFAAMSGKAKAFSVLTEPFWFLGDWRFLEAAKEYGPALAKDFVVSRAQIDVAYGHGADAVLLIEGLLGDDIAELAEYARTLGITPLVEVGSEGELEAVKAMGLDALVGVNARDLNTLDVSFERALEIAERARGLDFILESGINTPAQVVRACRAGARGVLIGTALMKRPGLINDILAELRASGCPR